MGKGIRYSDEFKQEAVNQVAVHGYSVNDVPCRRVKERYRFIKSRSSRYPVRVLCRTLDIHPSGYYDWLKSPVSKREREDQQLAQKIRQFWIESGGFHGYRNIYMDFRDNNQYCGRDRILRLMQKEGIRAQRGYNTPRGYYSGKPDIVAANELNREFNVERPSQW